MGLNQVCNIRNAYGNVLDVIFTNITCNFNVDIAQLPLTPKTSMYHKNISLRYFIDSSMNKLNNEKTYVYDFDRADFASINDELLKIDNYDDSTNLNEIVNDFYDKFLTIINKYTPKRLKQTLTCPAHFDRALRILRNKRNAAFRKYAKTNKSEDYSNFVNLREQFIAYQ